MKSRWMDYAASFGVASLFSILMLGCYEINKMAGDVVLLSMPVWMAGAGFFLGRALARVAVMPVVVLAMVACIAFAMASSALLEHLDTIRDGYISNGLFFYYKNFLGFISQIASIVCGAFAALGCIRARRRFREAAFGD